MSHDITHMWNFKKNEVTYLQKEIRLTNIKNSYSYQRRNMKGQDKSEAWDEHTHTTIYK